MSIVKLCGGNKICYALRECRRKVCHTLCVQSIVCYTFADGAGVKICYSPFLSDIFSQTAKLQKGGRLPQRPADGQPCSNL